MGESTIAAGKQEESGIIQWFPGESTGTTPSGEEVIPPSSVDGGQDVRITALEEGGGGGAPTDQNVFKWSTAPIYNDNWDYLPKSFAGEMRVGGGLESLNDVSEILVDDTTDINSDVTSLWSYMFVATSDYGAYTWIRLWNTENPDQYAVFEIGSITSTDNGSLAGTNFRSLNVSTLLASNGNFEEGNLIGLEVLPDQVAYSNLQSHLSSGYHPSLQLRSEKDQSSGYAGLTYNGWLTNSALSGPSYTMPAQSGQIKYYTDRKTFESTQTLAIATRCGLSVSDIAANSTTVLTWSESFDTANLHATGSSQFQIGNNPETGADYSGIYRVYVRLGWLSPVGGTLRRLILLLNGSEVVRHETDPTGPASAIVDYNTIDTILQLGSSSRLTVTAFQDSNTGISVEGYIYLVYMGDYPTW